MSNERLEGGSSTRSLPSLVSPSQPSALDRTTEPNTRFKTPISFLSVATMTVAAILLTIFVVAQGHVEAGAGVLIAFALILFGPVSLFYLVLDSPWPITVGQVVLLTATPALLLAATFWRSRYSVVLKRLGWFFWAICSLMVAGVFI